MTADQLSTEPEMTDPTANGFDPASIPSKVGEVLSKYLDGLPDEERQQRVRVLLTVLAYARGAGLDDPTWLAFAKALQYPAKRQDLDFLRSSGGSDYLLQTTAAEQDAPAVTRLFHQALADELLVIRDQRSDEGMLFIALLDKRRRSAQGGRRDWQDGYALEHLAEHAVAAGRLDELLEDPHYVVDVDPGRLVPHLNAARSAEARAVAAVYRQTAHQLPDLDGQMRSSQLELTAHRSGYATVAASIATAVPDRPWQMRWSRGRRIVGHQILTGHTGPVTAVAVGQLPDAGRTPVIISGGGWEDSTIRVWRLDDGTPLGEPLHGHNSRVAAVTVGRLVDGTPVIVSGDGDGIVRVWRLEDGTPVGEPLRARPATWPGWPPGIWTTAPLLLSAAVTTARYGCGGSTTVPRSGSHCAARAG